MDSEVTTIVPHLIGGERINPGGRTGPVYNPALGRVVRQVALGSAEDARRAVAAASAAFPEWSGRSLAQRVQVMFKFRELLIQHRDELVALICEEHGKVPEDARGSLTRGLEVVEFACGIPQLLKGEYSAQVAGGVDSFSQRQPVGVCVGITPFNFPAMVPLWMFPIAIACGNTFVLKPSEQVPSCPLRMAELMQEAGLPEGVLNVVNGDKTTVEALLTAPEVQAVSFVGSTAVGEQIYRIGTDHGKRVQALCGAKNHMLVMPDADMDQAADAVLGAAYGSAGERCMAVSVVVAVGDDTADALTSRLLPKLDALKYGPAERQGCEMGPLISAKARDRVADCIASGIEQGATLLRDGREVPDDLAGGFFIGPTLFDHVGADMRIYREEIFGPVLSVVRAPDYADGLKLISDHEYGNGCAIFTRDGDAARDFCDRVRIGMVGVNVPIPVPLAFHSFGGWKRSLFGDHAIHGPEGVRFYTRLKTVTARWPSGIRSGAVFNFRAGGEH